MFSVIEELPMSDPNVVPPTGPEPSAEQKARLELARQIFEMFRWERGVHLLLNALTFALLLVAAGLVIYKQKADKGELALICGSGGLIGFTSNRLLVMWTDVMNRVFGKQ
jgi:hypothetical protein